MMQCVHIANVILGQIVSPILNSAAQQSHVYIVEEENILKKSEKKNH